MREFASPATYVAPRTGNLTDDVVRHARSDPDRPMFAVHPVHSPGTWTDVTADEFHQQVVAVARGLIGSGVGPGDRVALLCSTRFEWTLLDYAIWFAGAVSVPLYDSSPAEQVGAILRDSRADVAVVERLEHRERIGAAASGRDLRRVWCLDGDGLDELVAAGSRIGEDQVDERRRALRPTSLATLVYTSGTTGDPKGCELTHGNFLHEIGSAVHELDLLFEDDASTLLFLPLAHVFARVVQVGAVHMGVRLAHSADVRRLMADLESFAPTFILGVPRVFEKLFTGASQRAAADGRGRLFDRAAEAAIAYSRASDGGRPGRLQRARHVLYDRLVYARLRESLGGRCRYAISGGAPLGERLAHFFRGIGLTVLEGYGLTETTAAVTVNSPDQLKIGTVGRPVGGTAVRVDEDGELLVRGEQVMSSYWNDEVSTRAVLDGAGWLRTGDLGEIDSEGFVRVIGRKQEILVTAGGKVVAPSALEDRIRQHPLVDHCVLVGDGRPFVAALVTLDRDALREWALSVAKPGNGRVSEGDELVRRLHHDPDLRSWIQAAVDEANKTVSRAEAVRRFEILPVEWSEDGGQLTPSLKVKRAAVLKEFAAAVEELYR